MKIVYFRFYEELNDFLPPGQRKVSFQHDFQFKVSVKDMVESLGVPHAEVDMILVNGKSVDFNYIVNDKDEISVYPVFESFDISGVQHLRPAPLRIPRFVVDVHLGTLAKYMRMAGLDTTYENSLADEKIVKISLEERRTILTKDIGILKRSEVTHGYYVRSASAEEQLAEIVERFDLYRELKEFSRCLECNFLLEPVSKEEAGDKIPPRSKEFYNEFFICGNCDKVYWKGSHYRKMQKALKKL